MLDVEGIPLDPGCYMFLDKDDVVVYVGKAKSLRKRVRSYFSGKISDAKTHAMISEAESVDYFVTSTETEALVLENNLINKYRPKYNINLKDSHQYAYINVTDETYPRLLVARERDGQGRFYGPFVNADGRDNIMKALRTAFGIRTCKRLRKKACLRYHIKLCSAPCIGNVTPAEYGERIRSIERFLDGKVTDLISDIESEMERQSKLKNFENAIVLRNQSMALKTLMERQQVEKDKRYNEDIINYIVDGGIVYLLVFNILNGVLDTKHEFIFPRIDNFLDEFVTQYYSEGTIPSEIILPNELTDDAIEGYLTNKAGRKVRLTVPKRGRKFELLGLVKRNIEVHFLQYKQMMVDLQEKLRLPSLPETLECIDISHISGSHTVGSMVRFKNGKPDKSNYRRYRIRAVDGIDDLAAISEVVHRRYSKLMRDGAPMPDLIIIDGGKGQLMAALSSLSALGLKIPIISLAKRNEDVYLPGRMEPLSIPKRSLALRLLENARDESHRFAINYHKLLRSKGMFDDVREKV